MKNSNRQNFNPLVSIITVVYNGEQFLEETIESIVNQTYENIEYIIIDGGSCDGTLEIIKRYKNKINYWVSEKDDGIYDAMNKGIKTSTGDIIGIVNADDYLYLDTIEKIVEYFQNQKIDFTYGDLDIIDLNSNFLNKTSSLGLKDFKYKLFKQMPFLHPTMFVRKEVYESIGLYDLEYKLSADYDFILRLIKNNYKFLNVNFSTGCFRLGGQSGGIESYIENNKLLLKHKVNPLLVYLNSVVLISKLYFRKIFIK